jgi:hypothetical protein
VRKKIVATTEGKPGDYQIRYIDTLKRELADVTKEFEQLLASELPALNESLRAKGQQPIPVPLAKVVVNEATSAEGGAMNPSANAEAPGASILPADFRLLH